MSADRSARVEATRLLAAVDVHPTSLPPSAVLLVRRLADPAPGSVNTGGANIQPSRSWTRALQRAVDRAARDAVRPATGPVPPSAGAVLFLDPAELLACLARDFLKGDVSRNWWWQAWLRAAGRSTLDLVLDAWSREARAIPAAIAALQRQDLATHFVRALSSTQVFALVVAVAEAYECPSLVAIARQDTGAPATPREPTPVVSEFHSRGELERAAEGGREPRVPVAPWERFIPSVVIPASLPIEPRLLLGVTLSLWHAPLAVRTREFQRALHTWRRDAGIQPSAAPDNRGPDAATSTGAEISNTQGPARSTPEDRDRDLPIAPVRPVEAAVTPVPAPPRERESGPSESTQTKSSPDDPAPIEPRAPRASAASETADLSVPAVEESSPRPRFVETPARRRERQPLAIQMPPRHAPETDALARDSTAPRLAAPAWPRVQGNSVATELGGVLFLVNVLERLRFFDRLDDHFRIASPVGAWSWLEIVTRCLLGSAHTAAAVDPIWDVLADLDGRPRGVPLTPAARVPRQLKLPATWPSSPHLPRTRVRPLGFAPPPDLRRFLDLVVPYVRWRLRRALDLDGRRESSLASRLFYHRGRLEWTATHVDLHMEMSAIDIAVRLAGLDANPGWVPALGRVVTFHFD